MQTEIRTERNIEIFKVSGTLDMLTVPVFKQQLNDLFINGKSKIIFNLAGLEFVDSAGLEAFISSFVTAKKTKRPAGPIVVIKSAARIGPAMAPIACMVMSVPLALTIYCDSKKSFASAMQRE